MTIYSDSKGERGGVHVSICFVSWVKNVMLVLSIAIIFVSLLLLKLID